MKAILVIDMPNNCYDCQYCRFDARRYNFRGCVLTDTEVQDGTIDICKDVHSCCPLKPLPTEFKTYKLSPRDQEEAELFINMATIKVYADGYNACLKEIEGD